MMNNNRPLSPHIQVYKLPLTGIISITHRITGVMLSLGLIFFVYVVSTIDAGADAYMDMQSLMNLWIFKLIYWVFIYALFFHLCHGVRHLIWDIGNSFEKEDQTRYALYELCVSLLLTLVVYFLI